MNSGYNGELRLPDGTHVRTVSELPALDWRFDPPDSFAESVKPDFRSIADTTFKATGMLTSENIASLLDMMVDHYLTPPEIYCYVPTHRYLQLQYAAQGKRYPNPRKRKSQARMSKKWRNKA
jgi:hypothetical protein